MSDKNLPFIAAFVLAAAPIAQAALVIPQWRQSITVYDSSSGQDDTSIFATVQNPFQASHSVNVGISTSESAYDFAWTAGAGSFLVEAAHQAEDIDDGFLEVRSTGYIWVEPSINLSLEISAAYDYYLPPGMMLAILEIYAVDFDASEFLFHSRQRVDSYDGYPASGTLTIDGNAILPAGHTTVLHYEMIIDSSTGGAGLLGTGNGFVDFQITPEPSTASLLLLAALALAKPRRPRHR